MRSNIQKLMLASVFAVSGWTAGASAQDGLQAETIRAEQAALRSAVLAGQGAYKELAPDRKTRLLAEQDRVEALLSGVDSTLQLGDLQQAELLNTLTSIQTIVNQAEDERMVCQRSKPIGSNRPRTECKTVAQRRMEREAAQQDMGRRNLTCSESTMGAGGCGN